MWNSGVVGIQPNGFREIRHRLVLPADLATRQRGADQIVSVGVIGLELDGGVGLIEYGLEVGLVVGGPAAAQVQFRIVGGEQQRRVVILDRVVKPAGRVQGPGADLQCFGALGVGQAGFVEDRRAGRDRCFGLGFEGGDGARRLSRRLLSQCLAVTEGPAGHQP